VESGVAARIVIEAAGNVRAFETAVALTGPGGTLVTVGLPAPDARASISPLALVAQGRSIVGSYLGSAEPQHDMPIFVERWRRGRLRAEELVSSRIELADVDAAMDEPTAGNAVRQLVVFDGERG